MRLTRTEAVARANSTSVGFKQISMRKCWPLHNIRPDEVVGDLDLIPP
jgi:hypothetical protein